MPRGTPAGILAQLNADVIADGFFYEVDIAFRSGTRYWDQRGLQLPAGTGTAQAGSASTITLPVGSSAVDDFYVPGTVTIISGTGVGQSRPITGYVGSTGVATVSPNWATDPDNTSVVSVTRDYEPRIVSISDLAYLAGNQREVTFKVSNADGLITTISQSESTYGCSVIIRRWVPAANASYVVWVGFLEELTEVGPGECTLTAYADVPGMNSRLPRRQIDVTCPHEFGSALTNGRWVSTLQYDGAECGYGRIQGTNTTATTGSSSMIGFYGTLSGNVAPGDSTITVVISSTFQAAGMVFVPGDRIRIAAGTEAIQIDDPETSDGLTWTLSVERAVLGGDPGSYTSGNTVFFQNCQKSTAACKCRGLYGNNPNDGFMDPGDVFFAANPSLGKSTDGGTTAVARLRNYYGGFPLVTGYLFGKFQTRADQKAGFQTVSFASNESGYGKALPLVYGRVRLANPQLLCAMAQGTFLSTLWAVCEGVLATNPNDDTNSEFMYIDGSGNPTSDPAVVSGAATNAINPKYQYNAFCPDPSPPPAWGTTPTNPYAERYLRVNGSLRHDPRPGFGVQLGIGNQEQGEPIYSFLPNVTDFEGIFSGTPTGPSSAITLGNRLGMWGTVWVCLKIDTSNSPSVDINGATINGTIGIQYGRLVAVYSNPSTFVYQATTCDAWVIFDVMTARRAGGGVPVAQMNVQSFLDHATYCNEPVLNVAIADGVTTAPRFTFNGAVDDDMSYDEWIAKLCMGCSATRPYLDAQGLYNIRTLRALTDDELAAVPVFTDQDAVSRNVLWQDGQTTVKKFRRRRKDQIPNRIRANFVSASGVQGYQVGTFIGLLSETITLIGGSGLFTPGVSRVAIGGQGSYLVTAQTASGNVALNITVSPAIANFTVFNVHRQPVTDLSDFQKVQIVIDDEPSQTLTPGGIRNIVEKTIDLVGCTTLDQAIRRATLVLRIGEFGEGGLANNEGIRWSTFVKGGSDCAIADVIAMESSTLDPILERYWRITDINDTAIATPNGAQVFQRDFEAMIHDNSYFDDTGFTVSAIIPINPGSAANVAPPAVTSFSASDAGTVDQNGTLMTTLTFTYVLPPVTDQIRSIVIMRSHDDGSGNPVGDWELIAELTETPSAILYPVSGLIEWFCAVSRPLTGHLPNTDSLNKDGSYTYPRVSVLVDGMADSPLGTPTGLVAFGEDSQIRLVWNAYTGTDAKTIKWFNIYRNTVNDSSTATLIDKSATTWYIDSSSAITDNPTEIFYYWIKGVSKLEGAVINGVTQDGLSSFSAVASDNAGTDTAVPNEPVINVLEDVTNLDGNFTFVIGVDVPSLAAPNGTGDTAPTNWDTVESIRIQIATDAGFSSIVLDQTEGFTKPPYITEYEVQPNALGTYYFRASIANIFGSSPFSAVFVRNTDYQADTDLMAAPTSVSITTSSSSNDLSGLEFNIELVLPTTQTESYFGPEYLINDVNTLPAPDVDSANSSYAVTGTVGTGNVTVGSNVLTDTTKSFPTAAGGLVGRRCLVFSEKRPTSGAWATEGCVDIKTIQANTATTLTFDRAVRLTGANIQYAVLTSGGLYTEEKVLASAVIPDYSQDGVLVGPKNNDRTFRVPTSLRSGYVWINLENLWGNGALAGPYAVSTIGTTFRSSASNPSVQIDPTNGLVAYNSSGGTTFQVDPSGNVWCTSMTAVPGVIFDIIGNGLGIGIANKNAATAGIVLEDNGSAEFYYGTGQDFLISDSDGTQVSVSFSSTGVTFGGAREYPIAAGPGTLRSNTALYVSSDSTNGAVCSSLAVSDAGSCQWLQRKARGTHASPSDVISGDALATHGYEAYSGGYIGGTYMVVRVSTNSFTSGQRPPTEVHFRTNNANGGMTDFIVGNQDQSVTMPFYGAGSASFGSGGVLQTSSDERLKTILSRYGGGLAEVLELSPIIYRWNELSGFADATSYLGFSAQEVQRQIPLAVGCSRDGYLSLSDRGIIAALVNAVKELKGQLDALSPK